MNTEKKEIRRHKMCSERTQGLLQGLINGYTRNGSGYEKNFIVNNEIYTTLFNPGSFIKICKKLLKDGFWVTLVVDRRLHKNIDEIYENMGIKRNLFDSERGDELVVFGNEDILKYYLLNS